MNPNNESDYTLTPKQAARRLGVTPVRVRQLTNAGLLAHVRTPLGRLISAAAVEERLKQPRRSFGPTAPGSNAIERLGAAGFAPYIAAYRAGTLRQVFGSQRAIASRLGISRAALAHILCGYSHPDWQLLPDEADDKVGG